MPGITFYPDSTISSTFARTGAASDHAAINKGLKSPNIPDTSSYIYNGSGAGGSVGVYGFETSSGLTVVTQVDIVAYINNPGASGSSLAVRLFMGGGWRPSQSFANGSFGYQTLTFLGTWNQADADAMQVELTGIDAGNNQPTVYSVYATVQYQSSSGGPFRSARLNGLGGGGRFVVNPVE